MKKGASCYVGWDGPVSLTHTDTVFIEIVKQILNGEEIDDAVKASLRQLGNDPTYNTTLLIID